MNDPFLRRFPPAAVVDVARLYGRALCRSLAAAGETDMRGCLVDLVTGRQQLWGIFEPDVAGPLALFRTEIVLDTETSRYLEVSALAGTGLRRWARLVSDTMQATARELGCASVRFAGRDAWGRVLPECAPVGDVDGETIFERTVAP